MRIRDYLGSQLHFIVINLILFCIVGGVTLYVGAEWIIVFCILLSWFVPLLTYMLVELLRSKKYYDGIEEILEGLDQQYLLPELIEETEWIHGKLLNDVLKRVGRAMHEHINAYRDQQESYREYIETWVHEIKTPIASIKLVVENYDHEVTHKIEPQVERIANFVEQVLYYARSEDVSKDYIIKETDLKDSLYEVIRRNHRDFVSKKIKLNLENLEYTVYTDSKWLKFILNQILGNAIKYSVGSDGEIHIFSQEKEHAILITIADQGIGISEKDINRVFEKGFTGENGRRFGRSTGMGLYLCKKLCVKLGLGITITSKVDEGTQVTLIFPKMTSDSL
ncbi:MAG: sensor histidine kinase [Cellulosilyticaceae bacterium]